MRNPEIVTAIIVGCTIISGGMYFGLRQRSSSGAADASAGGVSGFAPPSATAAAENPPALPPPPGNALGVAAAAESTALVRKAVTDAIEAARPGLRAKCWDDLAKTDPEPKQAKLTWHGTIGPTGKPTAFGISDHREAFRPGVSACVSNELSALVIPKPPAQPVEVSVDFNLP